MANRAKIKMELVDADVAAEIAMVMQRLDTSDFAWDAVIFGDGSGTGWNAPCGWAAVIYDRLLGKCKRTRGGMDCGTSYLAELMPYVQSLSWYMEGHGRHLLHEKKRQSATAKLRIHIFTDNEAVAKQGQHKIDRKTGDYYWAMLDAIEARGVLLLWHHLPRMTTALNRLCDKLAGEQRLAIAAATINE